MEDYFKKLGIISSNKDALPENRTWKDGIEFPAPDMKSLRDKKKGHPHKKGSAPDQASGVE